jgi:hypothetical protein
VRNEQKLTVVREGIKSISEKRLGLTSTKVILTELIGRSFLLENKSRLQFVVSDFSRSDNFT